MVRLFVLVKLEKRTINGKVKLPSRKHRRRPGNLLSDYMRRQRQNVWLGTHIWHAKRFKMVTEWGYRLAYRPCDKNLRACYRSTRHHCLLQVCVMSVCVIPVCVMPVFVMSVCLCAAGLMLDFVWLLNLWMESIWSISK